MVGAISPDQAVEISGIYQYGVLREPENLHPFSYKLPDRLYQLSYNQPKVSYCKLEIEIQGDKLL